MLTFGQGWERSLVDASQRGGERARCVPPPPRGFGVAIVVDEGRSRSRMMAPDASIRQLQHKQAHANRALMGVNGSVRLDLCRGLLQARAHAQTRQWTPGLCSEPPCRHWLRADGRRCKAPPSSCKRPRLPSFFTSHPSRLILHVSISMSQSARLTRSVSVRVENQKLGWKRRW